MSLELILDIELLPTHTGYNKNRPNILHKEKTCNSTSNIHKIMKFWGTSEITSMWLLGDGIQKHNLPRAYIRTLMTQTQIKYRLVK